MRCGIESKTLAALGLVLVVAVILAVQHFWAAGPRPVRAPAAIPVSASPVPPGAPTSARVSAPQSSAARQLVVDVAGKVHRPGIHRLPAGSRVADALQAAGGALRGVSLRGVNRARLLTDGEQVLVGMTGAGPDPGVGAEGTGGTAGTAGQGGPAGRPVSLNTATVEQLDGLPGVGPVLAQHIIDFRSRHGGFLSVDQLREVNGIGDRRFADLRALVQP
ncbi:ComEA family DNA-binding protein [Streptomyces sp. NPDC003077]|uniref:ComEA family DNA-binding protein n=1 Tax=Streptomyces sp. NPDC003077 TaxID=3154443 RepID=UPI0033B572F7